MISSIYRLTEQDRLYCVVYPGRLIGFMREESILRGCLEEQYAAYFAEVPADKDKWHTDTSILAEYGSGNIVIVESPISINGFPMILWTNARDAAGFYQSVREDALRCMADSETLNKMGYLVDKDKPLTFVFLHELPKLKRTFEGQHVVLEEIGDIRETLEFLESNFSTKYARCDLVRQTVDWETFSATLND